MRRQNLLLTIRYSNITSRRKMIISMCSLQWRQTFCRKQYPGQEGILVGGIAGPSCIKYHCPCLHCLKSTQNFLPREGTIYSYMICGALIVLSCKQNRFFMTPFSFLFIFIMYQECFLCKAPTVVGSSFNFWGLFAILSFLCCDYIKEETVNPDGSEFIKIVTKQCVDVYECDTLPSISVPKQECSALSRSMLMLYFCTHHTVYMINHIVIEIK